MFYQKEKRERNLKAHPGTDVHSKIEQFSNNLNENFSFDSKSFNTNQANVELL